MTRKINEMMTGKRKVFFGLVIAVAGIVIEYTKGLTTESVAFLLGIAGLVITGNLISKRIGK